MSESKQMKKADIIRQIEHTEMAEHEQCKASVLIKEQGKQILRESAESWFKRKNISI